jgi:mono/diheme cytochrome c family protein
VTFCPPQSFEFHVSRPSLLCSALRSVAPLALVGTLLEAQAAAVPEGKTTFETICAACHSVNPPAKLAPPMSHVSRYYKRTYSSETEFVEAVVRWVREPDRERSKMPAHVFDNFAIMPAFPLPEPQLREVAKYIWTLAPAEAAPAATPATSPATTPATRPPR